MYKNTPNKVFYLYGFWQKIINNIVFQGFLLISVVNAILLCALSVIVPQIGEAYSFWSPFIIIMINGTLLGCICFMILSTFGNIAPVLIGKGIAAGIKEYKKNKDGEVMALPAGEYNNPIHPDILMVQRPGESPTDYIQRIEDAKTDLKPDVWLVCLKRSFDRIVVESARPNECRTVPRSMFDDPTQPVDYTKESKSDFEDYLSYFAAAFQGYSISTKFGEKTESGPVIKSSERPILKFMGYVRACANIFLLLLFALSLSAQSKKDIVVRDMSGMSAGTIDSGSVVYYHFNCGTVTKNVRAKTNFAELINDGRPHNYSQLQRVDVNQKAVWVSSKQTIESTGTAEKPAPLMQSHAAAHNEAVPQKSFSESLPDSAAVANTLNQAKEQIPIYKQIVFKMFKPVWEFAAWLFFFLCPLFGIALGFCNLVSRSARQNGNLGPAVADQQIRFAAAAWWISICVVGSAYICITASMFFWEWNPYVITSLCILGYIPAKWAINRLTPNGEYQETITTTRSNGRISGGGGRQLGM